MAEYISKQDVIDYLNGYLHSLGYDNTDLITNGQRKALINAIQDISAVKAADIAMIADMRKENDELKRLLKAAINDIYKECTCDTWGCIICEHLRETCDYDDRFTWRHKAEALKLIGEDGDAE